MAWRTLSITLAVLAAAALLSCDLIFPYRAAPSRDGQPDAANHDVNPIDAPPGPEVHTQLGDGQGEGIPQKDTSVEDLVADQDTAPFDTLAKPDTVPSVGECSCDGTVTDCSLTCFVGSGSDECTLFCDDEAVCYCNGQGCLFEKFCSGPSGQYSCNDGCTPANLTSCCLLGL